MCAQSKGEVLGRVVGFSSQISSVLVPQSFINYSNAIYGSHESNPPNRLFVKFHEGKHGALEELMIAMNLDISEATLSMSKIKTYVNNILFFMLVFSGLILILAIVNLLQYVQIVIVNVQVEISKLLKIGYAPKLISHQIIKKIIKVLSGVGLVALICAILIKYIVINALLLSNGIALGHYSVIYGILFVILMVILFTFVVKSTISKTIVKNFNRLKKVNFLLNLKRNIYFIRLFKKKIQFYVIKKGKLTYIILHNFDACFIRSRSKIYNKRLRGYYSPFGKIRW